MSELEAEINGMSNEEFRQRWRTDGQFVSRILDAAIAAHPEMIETSGQTYSTQEVAEQLGIELPPVAE